MFGSCLPWKALFVLSLAVLHADSAETGAFAGLSECKTATINDVKESLEPEPLCCLGPACQPDFPKEYLDVFGHNSAECRCCECKCHSEPPLKCNQGDPVVFCKQLPLCPRPVAPKNGGLVCVTIDDTQYCKPMCNKGYDFQFLRSSRLYEVCGNGTGFSWTTQLVGGKALAVCNPSEMAISGAKSAYFPSNSTCVHTLAFPEAQTEQLNIFLEELAEQGIDGSRRAQGADCIICGY